MKASFAAFQIENAWTHLRGPLNPLDSNLRLDQQFAQELLYRLLRM